MRQLRLCLLVVVTLFCCTSTWAQTDPSEISVIHETDTVWGFGYNGVNLYERPMHRIDIAYPSMDPEGNPTMLSGYIAIPSDLYNGEQPVDGIVLYNHYTQLRLSDAPTRGYATGEDMVLANPLRPNYIVVCADFYGFGITEGKGQWYCFGDVNGQASIDCLLAAKEVLSQRGISQGRYLINAGYSSGGYDAVATQKVRDMKYSDQISFDRTIVGGLPFDLVEAYDYSIIHKDEPGSYFGLLLILDSYNTHANLGLTVQDMLMSPWDEKFDEWMHSGLHPTEDLKEALKGLKLTEIVKDTLLNTSSPAYKKLCQAMREQQLQDNWVPDTTQNYTVFHLFRDEVVPVSSGRAMLNFLSNYKFDGKTSPWFRRSIIPEQTHLNTNFVINSSGHTIVGGIGYYLELAATLTALPVLYYDGELNTHYADLIKDATPMGIIKQLEVKGYDLKKMFKEKTGGASSGGILALFEMMNTIDGYLEPFNLKTVDVLQMADDSGLSLNDIIEIYNYLSSEDEEDNTDTSAASAPRKVRTSSREDMMMPGTPDFYLNYLNGWFENAKCESR